MKASSYQTVRLVHGRHSSRHAGVCVMEQASMLAHEPFSDRAPAGCAVARAAGGLALATPEVAGAWAARAALNAGAHDEALALVDELAAMSGRPSRWPRFADPARVLSERLPA